MSTTRVRVRIWADGDGFWCCVRLPGRAPLVMVWTPGTRANARAEARDAIAKHQAERREARRAA